jgi:hypothetical protein
MTMTTPFDQLTAPDVSSLVGYPVVGWLIGLMDGALADLGFVRWLRETIELVLLVIVLYQVAKLLLRHLVPWFAGILVTVLDSAIDLACSLLLLPDLVLTKALLFAGRRPPDLQYACGHGVLGLGDRAKALVQLTVPKLAAVSRMPGFLIFAFVALSLFWWNNADCLSTVADACSTPVERWILSTGL